MKLFTVKQAKDNVYSLINEVAENHNPITIKCEHNDAVLISREDWDMIAKKIYLNSIPGVKILSKKHQQNFYQKELFRRVWL